MFMEEKTITKAVKMLREKQQRKITKPMVKSVAKEFAGTKAKVEQSPTRKRLHKKIIQQLPKVPPKK